VKKRTLGSRNLLAVLPAVLMSLLAGCGGCSDSSTVAEFSDSGTGERYQAELFEFAVVNLHRLEEFSPGDVFEKIFQRIARIRTARGPSDRQENALMLTCPEPEMLREIINRLNRWVVSQEPPADWHRDGMVDKLPAPLRKLPMVEALDKLEFSWYDGFALREAVWLRNVSNWARGGGLDDVQRAKNLFDWTVRNIQLEHATGGRLPQLPWETLLFGRGTAAERAWVFILLCRQQRLDAALLVRSDQADSLAAPWRSWGVVAVLSKGQLYLFDPRLGLPVPAPDGIKLDKTGRLDIQPATLAQAAADDALLRRLYDDPQNPDRVESSDLGQVVALLEASPAYLSSRMALIESKLPPDKELILTAAPTQQASRLKAIGQVADVRLWTLPLETMEFRSQLTPEIAPGIRQRLVDLLPFYGFSNAPLRKGRMLYLAGKFAAPEGAHAYYLNARPSNRQLEEMARKRELEFYKQVRQANPRLPEDLARRMAKERVYPEIAAWRQAKRHASYWQGLCVFEERLRTAHLHAQTDYTSAIEWFSKRTLEDSPGGPWTRGATYNLARAYEASKQYDKAIELYLSDPTSPDHHGNRLRAAWLKELLPDAPK